MATMRRIRLLLVDDHRVIRAGLANLLSTEPDFAVVAQADEGRTAIGLWRTHKPDVCVLDLTMQGLDGVETLRGLREIDPKARVLMFTSSDCADDMSRAIAAGANGYITKNVSHGELFEAIRRVYAGGTPVSRDKLVDARPLAQDTCTGLTPREVEVLGLLREGFTNTDIARLLGITTHTVKNHVAGIITKLDVSDRTQAVARAFDLGILATKATAARRRSGVGGWPTGTPKG